MIIWFQNRRNKIILLTTVLVLLIGGLLFGIAVQKGWLLKPKAETELASSVTIKMNLPRQCALECNDANEGRCNSTGTYLNPHDVPWWFTRITWATIDGEVIGAIWSEMDQCMPGETQETITLGNQIPVGKVVIAENLYYCGTDTTSSGDCQANLFNEGGEDIGVIDVTAAGPNSLAFDNINRGNYIHGYVYDFTGDSDTSTPLEGAHVVVKDPRADLIKYEGDTDANGYFAATTATYFGETDPEFQFTYEFTKDGYATSDTCTWFDHRNNACIANLQKQGPTVFITFDMPNDAEGSPQEYGIEVEREDITNVVVAQGKKTIWTAFKNLFTPTLAQTQTEREKMWTIDPLAEGLDEAGSSAGMFFDSTVQSTRTQAYLETPKDSIGKIVFGSLFGKAKAQTQPCHTYRYYIYAFTRLGDWSEPATVDIEIPCD